MCLACDDSGLQLPDLSPVLEARARRIEAALPGRAVPDGAWQVALRQAPGHLPWPQLRRILESVEKAEASLCARLRCDSV